MQSSFHKILVSAIIISFTTSCRERPDTKSEEIPQLKIQSYLDSISRNYKGFKQNTVIRDEMNEALKTNFPKRFNKGLLNDLPMKLDRIEKCQGSYIANFEHYLSSKYYDQGFPDQVEIELYAFTDEKTAKKLMEGQFYLVDATFKEYLTFQNNDSYCAVTLVAPFRGFSEGLGYPEYQFGAIGVNLESAEPIDKRNMK